METAETTPKQEAAIWSLLRGKNQVQAAKDAKVSAKTVQRWMADPTFRSELDAARDGLARETQAHIVAARSKAYERLMELMASDTESVAYRASTYVLDRTLSMATSAQGIDSLLEQMELDVVTRLTGKGE